MQIITNYVIGVGPVGLITAKTLLDSGEKVVLIAPKQDYITNYSARNFDKKMRVKKNLGIYGGTARIWDFQCTRLSENAFNQLEISTRIGYLDYLESSKKIEEMLGIHNWPLDRETPNLSSNSSSTYISKVFSVIAKHFSWDSLFEKHIAFNKIERIHDEVIEIATNQERSLSMKTLQKIEMNEFDRIFIAAGSVGTYKILDRYIGDEKPKIDLPKDHPSMYVGRIIGIHNLELRKAFSTLPDGLKMKSKFKVEQNSELGIFELREKWPRNILSYLKRSVNLLLRMVRINTRFLPNLYLWVQVAQSKNQNQESAPVGATRQSEWTVTEADIENFHAIVESAEVFLKEKGMRVVDRIPIKSVKEFMSSSEEAFHPCGVIDLEEFEALSNRNVFVLGAAILGNVSWNNPTVPAMAISRIIAIQALNPSDD